MKVKLGVISAVFLCLISFQAKAQVFIPFAFWQVASSMINHAPSISSIFNRNIYEGNFPYIPFTISDPEDILSCSLTNLTRTSSNTTVVPLANITFTGAVPFCYVNIQPAAGVTGTSNISITVHDNRSPDLMATTSFTVTAYAVQSMQVLPPYAIIPKNTTYKFTAVANYSDGTSQDISASASWTEDSTYTTIDSTGLLSVNNSVTGYPTVNIGATYSSFSDTAVGTLNSSTITGFFVTPSAASINTSHTVQIKAYATTADGGTIDVTSSSTWSSDNTAVANVNNYSPKGEVTGITNGGPAHISASFSSFSDTSNVTVSAGAESQTDIGIGLFARYFQGMGFNTFYRQRVDSNVDFTWDTASNPAGDLDTFSARWTGYVLPPTSGNYTFYTRSDDGVRLWISDTLQVDLWTDHGSTDSTSSVLALTAGTKYPIVMEFYENGGNAFAQLHWKKPGDSCSSFATCSAVPQSQLFPDTGYGWRLDVAGTSDANPGNTNFANDNVATYYDNDGSGTVSNGSTVNANIGGTNSRLTANGAVSYNSSGLIGQAFTFSGSNYFTSSNSNSLPTGTNAGSVSLWVKPTNTGSSHGVFFYGSTSGTRRGRGLQLNSSGVVYATDGTSTYSSGLSVNWGQWNHIVLTYAGSNGNVSITVNGSTSSLGNKSWNTNSGSLYMGRNPDTGDYLTGDIDEFAVWSANIGANSNNFLPTQIYQRQNPSPRYMP